MSEILTGSTAVVVLILMWVILASSAAIGVALFHSDADRRAEGHRILAFLRETLFGWRSRRQ